MVQSDDQPVAAWPGYDAAPSDDDRYTVISHSDGGAAHSVNLSDANEAMIDAALRRPSFMESDVASSVPNDIATPTGRVITEFIDIAKFNKKETEQTFNIMCVGESGMGKSTLIEAFFKTVREQDETERLVKQEESYRVQEKNMLLTKEENKLREAEKEKKVLVEDEKLVEADKKRQEIVRMKQAIEGIRGEINTLRKEDQEHRDKVEQIKAEIESLKKQKEDAKSEDRLLDADAIKQELVEKEREKADLGRRLQRTPVDNGDHADDASRGIDNANGGEGARRLISGPTVEIKVKPTFDVKHRVKDEAPVILKVSLIDTPGYGDNTDLTTTFEKIVGYYVEQFCVFRQEEEKAERTLRRGMDPLVHCVFYFINPHRLKPVDIAFMKELHEKVPIIPVIAKSDTMTTPEKKDYKEEVRSKLQSNGINLFVFAADAIEEMSKQAEVAMDPSGPWAVVATKDAKFEDGKLKAIRPYPWGAADAANPQHSDLLALQELILRDGGAWKQLKADAEQKYNVWRKAALIEERKEAAKPVHAKLKAKALIWYSKVPPMCVICTLCILLAIILLPMAVRLGSWALLRHTSRHTETLRAELHNKTQDVKVIKEQIRFWHANSKAWWLEQLPESCLDE